MRGEVICCSCAAAAALRAFVALFGCLLLLLIRLQLSQL
jgi:hypothetical protein